MREKERGKKKNFIAAQQDLCREQAPYCWKKNDSSLSTSSWMEDFGKIYGPAFIAKKAWRVSRVNNFFYSFELLKITKQVLIKSIKKMEILKFS
jgi:hypothetical protein